MTLRMNLSPLPGELLQQAAQAARSRTQKMVSEHPGHDVNDIDELADLRSSGSLRLKICFQSMLLINIKFKL